MTDNMDDILEKYPEFENKLYIIGGSRREALKEAMAILLRLTNRCYLSTEWLCLKDTRSKSRASSTKSPPPASARVPVTISAR